MQPRRDTAPVIVLHHRFNRLPRGWYTLGGITIAVYMTELMVYEMEWQDPSFADVKHDGVVVGKSVILTSIFRVLVDDPHRNALESVPANKAAHVVQSRRHLVTILCIPISLKHNSTTC